jgi:DNA-binding beta-propeller fold protein YncE
MIRLKDGASDTPWRGIVGRTEGYIRMQRIRRVSVALAMVALAIGMVASSASAFPKYVYSSSFGSEGSGSGQFKNPEGMTSDSAGNVYVADYSNNRIEKFNSKGEFLKEFGKPKLNRPMDVAIDSKGNFWVTQETDTESIHKVVSSTPTVNT